MVKINRLFLVTKEVLFLNFFLLSRNLVEPFPVNHWELTVLGNERIQYLTRNNLTAVKIDKDNVKCLKLNKYSSECYLDENVFYLRKKLFMIIKQ